MTFATNTALIDQNCSVKSSNTAKFHRKNPKTRQKSMAGFLRIAFSGNINHLKQLAKRLDSGEGLAKTFESVKDDKGRNALHIAAAGGNISVCNYLIKQMKLDVNMRDGNGCTPLHHAVLGEQLATTQYLIRIGADISLTSLKGCTPLHFAAETGNAIILELLISHGAAIDKMSDSGTPLQMAVANGKKHALQILLVQNANPNTVLHHFFTPVLLSICADSPECLKLLLEAGADPNIGACGVLPLCYAVGYRQIKHIPYLLEYGADPNAIAMLGLTALECAALNKDYDSMKILFPVTAPIQYFPEWSIRGIIKHIHSAEVKAQRDSKKKDVFQTSKSNGKEAFQKKDYLNAIFWYTKAMDIEPSDETLFSNRSLCWANLNEGGRALYDARACVGLKPNWPKAHYREGSAWKLLKGSRVICYSCAAESS